MYTESLSINIAKIQLNKWKMWGEGDIKYTMQCKDLTDATISSKIQGRNNYIFNTLILSDK